MTADCGGRHYPGNNMFNSLGNLAVNPAAGLLFVDFSNGSTLHLTGKATVQWTQPEATGDDGGTGRRIRFIPHGIVRNSTAPARRQGRTIPRQPAPDLSAAQRQLSPASLK